MSNTKIVNGVQVPLTNNDLIQIEENKKNITEVEKELELQLLEKEMSTLNSDRNNLQDLIDLWLQADWDIEGLNEITIKLNELAKKRIELKK